MTIQNVPYLTSITVNLALGEDVVIGRLVGDVAIQNPLGTVAGTQYSFVFETDGLAHAVTFGSQFRISLDSLNIIPGESQTILKFFAWTTTLLVQLGSPTIQRVGDMGQLGSGLGSDYPGQVDTKQFYVNHPAAAPDGNTRLDAELANDALAGVIAIETTLGANPQGSYGSLRARLDTFLPSSGTMPAGAIPFFSAGGGFVESAHLFWDGFNSRMGLGTNLPLYRLDVRGTNLTQIHISSSAGNVGGYFTSVSDANLYLSGGVSWNDTGAGWVARATSGAILALQNGGLEWYANTGLTPGNVYTPTLRAQLTAAGWLGAGSIAPLYPLAALRSGGSQLQVTSLNADSGGYLTSQAASDCGVSGGVAWSGTGANWIAKAPNTSIIYLSDGTIAFYTNQGLTAGQSYIPTARGVIYVSGGMLWGEAPGGEKGHGTINALAIYGSGILHTSYPIAYALDGILDLPYWDSRTASGHHAAARRFAPQAHAWCDVEGYIAYWQEHRHLPSLPNPFVGSPTDLPSVDEMVQRLWENADLTAIHIKQLHERLVLLESR